MIVEKVIGLWRSLSDVQAFILGIAVMVLPPSAPRVTGLMMKATKGVERINAHFHVRIGSEKCFTSQRLTSRRS
jgi:hypothetical protein